MADPAPVFKGGTCLARVHAGFYRLSEDLDFVIPVPTRMARTDNSQCVAGLKSAIARLERGPPSPIANPPVLRGWAGGRIASSPVHVGPASIIHEGW